MDNIYLAMVLLIIAFAPANCATNNADKSSSIALAIVHYLEARP